jgi:hypothetical protein
MIDPGRSPRKALTALFGLALHHFDYHLRASVRFFRIP